MPCACAADNCETVIPDGEPAYTILFGSKAGEPICEECADYDLSEHTSSVTRYTGFTKETVRYGDFVAAIGTGPYTERVDSLNELPEWFTEHFGERSYHRSDGWRGHYENSARDLHVIASGWVTGYPDDSVSYKQAAIDFSLYLQENAGPDFPLYWAFDPTSNIFSIASDILVDEDMVDAFAEWLESAASMSVDKLVRSFQ